ncbi:murein L,D-transpeptidase [Aurantiacibacter spongiae]|uniref:Murein L,D-transpeptidase n=2 Tax=Aurantiacibacter spongiae TaxID=2488860 RepID=A0A3N5DLQ7_9SPHN|nr:murein L,D-transpeptidase [Aurantiacibacter spongiae]
MEDTDSDTVAQSQTSTDYGYDTYSDDNLADSMASNDAAYMTASREGASTASEGENAGRSSAAIDIPDPEDRPIMHAQVVLDRRGFGPGVIDGKMGQSTHNAIEGFQEASGLDVTGDLDDATKEQLQRWDRLPATRVVTIPASWGRIDYETIPDDPSAKAEMERLGYTSLDEKLAERFHTTVDVLKRLNPEGRPAGMDGAGSRPAGGASPTPSASFSPSSSASSGSSRDADTQSYFTAGQPIRVPNIGADRIVPGDIGDHDWQRTLASLGVGTEQPEVARLVVDKSGGWLKGYDVDDNLVAMFTVTTGSTHDPLPLGDWGITGISHNPPFSYDPDLFWDVPDSEDDLQLPPGPNGPVGVVWIDLTKEHYGIHGTGEPQTIGRVQSHGCVRLTNWDAARLAEMVDTNTKVVFQA